ncbi:hypothetical protein [Peribacillus loiseleuriae]|uniref:hypothetical protein n=1 Tax=Peribacillus loiseleuriae TaxID=1679170 RepID=UPI003D05FDE0
MASNTTRLDLLKKNPVTDGNDTFNIETMLNENWDKIDKRAALINPITGKLLPGQENAVDTSGLATKQELQAETQARVAHQANYLSHTGYATATGSANAYIATLTPALSTYQEGVSLRLKINVTNTGASTINVNGLGAKAIKKADGTDINVGQLKAGGIYDLVYNGVNFQLRSGGSDLSDEDMVKFITSINGILSS